MSSNNPYENTKLMGGYTIFRGTMMTLLALLVVQLLSGQDCVQDPASLGVQCSDEEQLQIVLSEGSLDVDLNIVPDDLIDASLPPCGIPTQLTLGYSDEFTGVPPTTSTLQLTALGFYEIDVWIADDVGHSSYCRTMVKVLAPATQCTAENDLQAPTLRCVERVVTSLSPVTEAFFLATNPPQIGAVSVEDFVDYYADNCGSMLWLRLNLAEESTGAPQSGYQTMLTEPGTYEVEVWASDQFNNSSSCVTQLVVEERSTFCAGDTDPPVATVPTSFQTFYAPPDEEVAFTSSDLTDVIISDNCSEVTVSFAVEDPFFNHWDLNYEDTLRLQTPFVDQIWVRLTDESGNSTYFSRALLSLTPSNVISGQIYFDEDNDCALTPGEIGPAAWTIEVRDTTGQVIGEALTALDGYYTFYTNNPTEVFEVALILPEEVGSNCPTVVRLEGGGGTYEEVNFAVRGVAHCEYLAVDISTPFLRRCFDNAYFIQYVNYSEFAVEEATIDVMLHPSMLPLTGPHPYTIIGDGRLRFELGTLEANSAGLLQLNIYLDCDADLGATHCVEAIINPFNCVPATSFADLEITGSCDEDSGEVNFKVENKGDTEMGEEKGIIVTEDVIMYLDPVDAPTVNLGPGQFETFTFPANGATWRVAVEQDDSNPYGGIAADFVEGCNGFTQGVALQFPLATEKPNTSLYCQEDISSFDPNDKQAFPYGLTDDYFIEANTPIDYMIRFQNTGTDTAFNVSIEDQLSPHLDYMSISPGASSHSYRMELTQEGLLTFYFDDIMLPDSNVNGKASKGFVKFSIKQLPDNPVGTVMENTASIFFDFNEAVVTNTVFHTIGEAFIAVGTSSVPNQPRVSAKVFPHPLETYTTIELYGHEVRQGHCRLYDALGRVVLEKRFSGQQLVIERAELSAPGLYWFEVADGSQSLVVDWLLVH